MADNKNAISSEDILKELTQVPSTIINEKDGTQLELIPEGEFLAGGPGASEGGDAPFPVKLPAYYLALYPVTNIQYARFLNQVQPSESDLKKWIWLDAGSCVRKAGSKYEIYGNKHDHPVVGMSWHGAKSYAELVELRLPTELEWERGARGVVGREFPWRDTWDESKCRCAMKVGTESTCSVHNFPDGRSPWGIYQMSGNILEWCEDSFDFDVYGHYRQGLLSPPAEDGWEERDPKNFGGMLVLCSRKGFRVLRGGDWRSDNPNYFRGAFRHFDVPVLKNIGYGFRLAKTAGF